MEMEYENNLEPTDLDNYEPVAKIIVIGVGGAGNNAVNRMIDEQIQNVEFHVVNTDKQALSTSKAPNRWILGEEVTEGLGAGGTPDVGEKAAENSEDIIRRIVSGAKMVFVAAGMGKGTGTGAAPVVARIAKESGALTVGIVTRPFTFEGKQRRENAIDGINKLKNNVDSLIIVSNDKLLNSSGNMAVDNAFADSDKVLAQSVKTVADLILVPAKINLDFADVRSTLKDGGICLIGYGEGRGDNKAALAAENAINSPLLETGIKGARKAILSITCGSDITLYEAQKCFLRVNEAAGATIDIKFGISTNSQLDPDTMIVSVIAADFEEEYDYINGPEISLSEITDERNIGYGADKAKENIVAEKAIEPDEDSHDFSTYLADFLKPEDEEE